MNIELNGTTYTIDTPITDGWGTKSFYTADSLTTRFVVFRSGEVRFVSPTHIIRQGQLPMAVIAAMQEAASLDQLALEQAGRAGGC